MKQIVTLDFSCRGQWRHWLEENHASEKEAWVSIHKKAAKVAGLKYDEALEEAICFGWIDGKMKSFDDKRFNLRFSPRKKNSLWSKRNRTIAEKTIKAGKMTRKGFEAVDEAKRNGKWVAAYTSKEAVEVPPNLVKALKQNKVAWENFSHFSNSIKLQYVNWVKNAKRDETIRKRIQNVVEKALKNLKPV